AAASKKLAAAEAELASLRSRGEDAQRHDAALQDRVAAALEDAAERVARMATDLARNDGDQGGLFQPDDGPAT
ncbi:MAG: hypothetical protein HYZ60_03415, partial [Methylocystis sp.]|nr:hypothetical protein [Methylocystis sp.]